MQTRALAVLTLAASVLFNSVVSAQPAEKPVPDAQPSPFRHETLTATDAGGDSHEYAYSVWRSPALDKDEPAPALIFLHGSGECGTDGEKQLNVGLPPQLVAHPEKWPFVVLIPQKPVVESEWEDHDAAITAMMDKEFKRENVDRHRVAITGLSQGGHGTISIATLHPGWFRAVAPVCAYIERWRKDGERVKGATPPEGAYLKKVVEALEGLPVWGFHGGRDDVVPPSEAHLLHDALEKAGSKTVKLTVFPEDNHNSWDSAYGKSELAAWLVEHTAKAGG